MSGGICECLHVWEVSKGCLGGVRGVPGGCPRGAWWVSEGCLVGCPGGAWGCPGGAWGVSECLDVWWMSGGVWEVSRCLRVSGEVSRCWRGCLGVWDYRRVAGCLGVCVIVSLLTPVSLHPSLLNREASLQHPHEDGRRLHHDEGRWVSSQPRPLCPAAVLGSLERWGARSDTDMPSAGAVVVGVAARLRPSSEPGVGLAAPSALAPWSRAGPASLRRRAPSHGSALTQHPSWHPPNLAAPSWGPAGAAHLLAHTRTRSHTPAHAHTHTAAPPSSAVLRLPQDGE